MNLAKTYAGLKKTSDEDLVQIYDAIANHTSVGLNFVAEELRHRDQAKINKSMKNLTWVITILTVLNTIFVFYSALK